MKISGLLITKNNGETLEWALRSVVKYLDELIIIDDFSTDNTVEIAQKYGALVYQNKFVNFSEQRNFGIGKCKGDWIFTMDADEVMGENLGDILPYLKHTRYRAFLFARYNLVHLDPDVIIRSPQHYSEWQVRVFKNDGKSYYANPVHHQLQNCRPRLKMPNINIFHFHFLIHDYATRKRRVDYYESINKGDGHHACYLFEDYPHSYSYGMEKIEPELLDDIKANLKMVQYEYVVDQKAQKAFERKIKLKTMITRLRAKLSI